MLIKKKRLKKIFHKRGNYLIKSYIGTVKQKNFQKLLNILKYMRFLNTFSKRALRLWAEKLDKIKQMDRKRSLWKVFFRFYRSKKVLKKLFFRLKRIERKEQIRAKRKYSKKNVCIIMFKKTNKNFFVIATDLDGQVITYCSAGMFSYSTNAKKKNSIFLVNHMMRNIVNKLKLLRIKTLRVVLRSNSNKHVFQAMKYLTNYRFDVEHVAFLKPIPHHNGQRKKKMKRL